MRRPRQSARAARLLHDRTHMPDLRGPRHDHQEPVPQLRTAPAWCRRSVRSPCRSPKASRTAPAFASPARASPAATAGRRAISTSSSASNPIRCLSATARTCLCEITVPFAEAALGRIGRGADARRRAHEGRDPERERLPANSCGCAAKACRRFAAGARAISISRSRWRRRPNCRPSGRKSCCKSLRRTYRLIDKTRNPTRSANASRNFGKSATELTGSQRTPVRVAILGCGGRMGQMLMRTVLEADGATLSAATENARALI